MRRLAAVLTALAGVALGVVPAVAPGTAVAAESVVEVHVSGPLAAETLQRQGFDLIGRTDTTARILLPDDTARRRLTAAGYRGRTLVADTRARTLRTLRANRRAKRSALPSGRTQYRVPADYASELQALATAHPGLVRRLDLPRASVQGRPIQGVEIASGAGSPSDGRPVFMVIGLHHAREWPSGEVAMELARDLAGGYGGDARITRLLDAVRVLIFPVTNPDGFLESRGTAVAGTGPNHNQRKNCAGGCASGVDLNRNYGAFWGGNGASTLPLTETYRGPGPWSEPESAAIHELSQRLHITNFTSIHNIAALVLRPPGFEELGLAPDEARLKALGDAMAAAAGPDYASEYGYELYEVTGATEDWNYVAQNAFGYTIELGPSSSSDFHGSYATHVIDQYLGPDGERDDGDGIREALLLAGEQAGDVRDHSVLEGSAPAGATLRLHRAFKTATSRVCPLGYAGGSTDCPLPGEAMLLDDGLDTSLVVPPSGQFTWHVTPSTRPFERKAGRTEAWTLTCTGADGAVLAENRVVVGIGERRALTPCTPAAGGGDLVPPPTAPAPQTVPDPPAFAVRSTTARRQRRATVLSRGVLVSATCARACELTTTVRRSTSRGTVIGRAMRRLSGGRRELFRVKLSAAARRAVRRGTLRRVVLRLEARGGGVQRVETLGVQLVAR